MKTTGHTFRCYEDGREISGGFLAALLKASTVRSMEGSALVNGGVCQRLYGGRTYRVEVMENK